MTANAIDACTGARQRRDRHCRHGAVAGAILLLSVMALTARPAFAAAPDDDLGGQIRATADGRIVQFPVLGTNIRADISGTMAAVTVEQTFANPTSSPLNATYLFPLNKDAAVHAMQMRLGDEVITAEIQRRETARQTFDTARRAGKSAALLEQHRPNMFTQSLANLMPGQPIKVTLRYVQPLPRIDGAYRLVVPLVVGPRYIPAAAPLRLARQSTGVADDALDRRVPGNAAPDTPPASSEAGPAGQWSLGPVPKYPPVASLTVPKLIDPDRVAITVDLRAGVPISSVLSTTHSIDITDNATDNATGNATGNAAGSQTARTITLKAGRTIDNRDFVLDYRLAGGDVAAGALAHRDGTGGYLSLHLEPPAAVNPDQITPREIVFVLDTSGSMAGPPIEASKAFMRQALAALTPADYFRIIQFANNAHEFTSQPVRATPANLARGRNFVESLEASGGTEVMPALRQAFGMAQAAGTKRMIVFLSDGYVGNEQEIVTMVAGHIARAHTFVLGVGTSVNRYLLAEMAHHGRGFMRIIDPTEPLEEAATRFARKLSTTVMTDLAIDWGTLQVTDLAPGALPDLFAGDSLRIHGRFRGTGRHRVTIRGRINGREAAMPLDIDLPPADTTTEALRAVALGWARATIRDEMRQLMTPDHLRRPSRASEQIQSRITELGLTHALMTQWTSFVAVSRRVVNDDPASARDADVPLPMVKGVGPEAYGKPTIQARAPGATRLAHLPAPGAAPHTFTGTFAGGATPEPEHLIGLIVVVLGVGAGLVRRRSSRMRTRRRG